VSAPAPADEAAVGVWRAERTAGGVALRRTQTTEDGICHWADVDYVPPAAGARRVVVIGESVARGCAYAQGFSPTSALARQLDQMAPGKYQCVDLARSGASAEILTRLVRQLPLVEPDVVVVIAGNNWVTSVIDDDDLCGAIAGSLSGGGPAAMRRTFIDKVALPQGRRFLDSLLALHTGHGTQIVVVVPEFNLQGWMPPVELEVPVLAPGPLARWYELRDQAERACGAADWAHVQAAAGEMSRLDGGTSPVPGQLVARAGLAAGDGAAARTGLEASRDALTGMGLPWCTPRIIGEKVHRHGRAEIRQHTRGGKADARRAAGDECGLSLEIVADHASRLQLLHIRIPPVPRIIARRNMAARVPADAGSR